MFAPECTFGIVGRLESAGIDALRHFVFVLIGQLLEACLRMKPDRILLAELRADEAFDYMRNVNSGHPGSITSVHASSAELAFEQLVLLVKQSPAGNEFSRAEIKALLYLLVDIVIQFGVEKHERFIKEVWYDPARRRATVALLN